MKSQLLWKSVGAIIIFLSVQISSYAQWTNISGVINKYVEVTDIDYCNTSLTLPVPAAYAGFGVGDKVLLIQMTGAKIDTSNSSMFGTVLNYNNTGNFELSTIWAVSGATLYMEKKLARNYSCYPYGRVQLVRVPQYVNANVIGTITPDPWNGYRGGVVAMIVSDTLKFQDSSISINADLSGFRAGDVSMNAPAAFSELRYYLPSVSDRGGQKGEGAAHHDYFRSTARGHLANGGGGGNAQSSGGGGGGNYGVGGAGGNQYNGIGDLANGGYGGTSFPYSPTVNQVFLGGGGGGGHQANNIGTGGGSGGGIIMIRAGAFVGNGGYIRADGGTPFLAGGYRADGVGGGGGGGSILLDINTYPSAIHYHITAKGADGAYVAVSGGTQCYGPGGGGGGGVIWVRDIPSLQLAVSTRTVQFNGGVAGIVYAYPGTSCHLQPYGATNGAPGAIIEGVHIPEGTQPR